MQRKAKDCNLTTKPGIQLHPKEKDLIKVLLLYPQVIQVAANECSPAVIANYAYDLVKEYNQFYQHVPIFAAANELDKNFRLGLSAMVGRIISSSMSLLGIAVPNRM